MGAEKNIEVRTTHWTIKPCDICGSALAESLGSRRILQRNRTRLYEFLLDDKLCLNCGFVFAGRVPEAEFLSQYYADAFTPDSQAARPIEPDFNPEIRLRAIRDFLPPGSSVLEIGSNTGEFCADLSRAGYFATGVDPVAHSVHAGSQVGFLDGQSIELSAADSPKIFDAVASYYVLEHVPDARAWISSWLPLLREGGKVFIEVPNFYTHPRESLVHEHLLHFTPPHLAALLSSLGFSVLQEDRGEASRPFGFCLVAQKKSVSSDQSAFPAELIAKGRSAYLAASELNQREDAAYSEMAEYIQGKFGDPQHIQFICWGANRFAAKAFQALSILLSAGNILVVDNSKQKVGLQVEGLPVAVTKAEFPRASQRKRVFLLCSPSHNPAIESQVRGMDLENAEIFDTISWLNDFDSARGGKPTDAQLIPQRK